MEGYGRLLGGGKVEVDNDGDRQVLTARDIIIATGSRPRSLPFLQIDEERIWSSTGALFQKDAPETLVVVGAGAVGMEFADIYDAYGTKVTVIEVLDRVLPLEDKDSSRVVAQSFRKRGMEIFTGARVESTTVKDDGVSIAFTDRKGNVPHPGGGLRSLGGPGGCPTRRISGWTEAGVKVTGARAVSSSSTKPCGPARRASGRWATAPAGNSWRTRGCTRASWPRSI